MYNSGVPEKLIMERSGHLSSKGVQAFERTTTKQQQVVCGVLAQKGQPMEGTWQPLKQRGSHGLVEVQLNEDQMAENMAEGSAANFTSHQDGGLLMQWTSQHS